MEIQLNGEEYVVEGETLGDLAAQLGLHGRRYAIEVNREIIPRGDHASHRLNDGDRVEVIHAVGGG
jgi:sulfur carrier protein